MCHELHPGLCQTRDRACYTTVLLAAVALHESIAAQGKDDVVGTFWQFTFQSSKVVDDGTLRVDDRDAMFMLCNVRYQRPPVAAFLPARLDAGSAEPSVELCWESPGNQGSGYAPFTSCYALLRNGCTPAFGQLDRCSVRQAEALAIRTHVLTAVGDRVANGWFCVPVQT